MALVRDSAKRTLSQHSLPLVWVSRLISTIIERDATCVLFDTYIGGFHSNLHSNCYKIPLGWDLKPALNILVKIKPCPQWVACCEHLWIHCKRGESVPYPLLKEHAYPTGHTAQLYASSVLLNERTTLSHKQNQFC